MILYFHGPSLCLIVLFQSLDAILRQLVQDDAFLSSHINNGDYEFLDPSGAAFSRLDQSHTIHAGWTVIMRFIDNNDKTAHQDSPDDTRELLREAPRGHVPGTSDLFLR